MTRPAPLAGIRVVDITQVLAGPYCTYQLALLGAEVIKVEPPEGEMTRLGTVLPELADERLSLSYCVQNSDKQHISVDLKHPTGLAAVLSLIDSADVFVQNGRPGVFERLGLGVDIVTARNPRIVYCSISAYGADGPLGGRPAYDHVVQAMSGIMETTGTEDSGPVKVGAPYVDYATGLNAAFAVLAALRERDRTGQPQIVDVAMLDTSLMLMASNLSYVATSERDLPKLGNEAASGAPSSGCFTGSDGGLVMLAANNERQFVDLCRALGRSEWSTDARWATPTARRANQDDLRACMAEVFASRTAAEWERRIVAHGVPISRVRRMSEMIAEGQPAARGLLHEVEVGAASVPIQLPGIGFRLNGNPLGPRRPPQAVGADNATWLPDVGEKSATYGPTVLA